MARVAPGSLIEQWNLRCSPLERVAVRDRLRKVNGHGGDGEALAKALANLGRKSQALPGPRSIEVKCQMGLVFKQYHQMDLNGYTLKIF